MQYIILLKYLVLIVILIIATIKDIKTKTISNKLILVSILLGCIFSVVFLDMAKVFDSIMGAIIGGGILLIISLLSKEGVGYGDVKLFFSVGLFLGAQETITALILSILASGIGALLLLITKKVQKSSSIPFAQFILIGTVIALATY